MPVSADQFRSAYFFRFAEAAPPLVMGISAAAVLTQRHALLPVFTAFSFGAQTQAAAFTLPPTQAISFFGAVEETSAFESETTILTQRQALAPAFTGLWVAAQAQAPFLTLPLAQVIGGVSSMTARPGPAGRFGSGFVSVTSPSPAETPLGLWHWKVF